MPTRQAAQELAPRTEENIPAAHAPHDETPAPPNKPTLQSVQEPAPAPELVPGGQGVQELEPLENEKVPGAHALHAEDVPSSPPADETNKPAWHAVQALAPAFAFMLSGQSVQDAAPVPEYVPAAHVLHGTAPPPENNPALHAVQEFTPGEENVPAGQVWHAVEPLLAE